MTCSAWCPASRSPSAARRRTRSWSPTIAVAGTTSRCSCRADSGRSATSRAATARWWVIRLVRGDWLLKPGDIIRIGHTQLIFVYKLSEAFTSSGDAGVAARHAPPEVTPTSEADDDDSNVLAVTEPTTITHRRGQTKLLAAGDVEEGGVSKMGARRPSSAGWPSSWPRRPTSRRWPAWPWPVWPKERRPTPGP